MTKTTIFTIATLTGLLLVTVLTQSTFAQSQSTTGVIQGVTQQAIPDWIKTTSGFWVNGDVSDTEYINAIEYLLKEEIMTVPSIVQSAQGQEISQPTIETLERQIEILEGGPQALVALEPDELTKLDCGPKPSQPEGMAAWALCKAMTDILDAGKKTFDEDEKNQLQFQTLSAEIKKAEAVDLDESPSIPVGATGTYVNYKKGHTDNNYRLTVECDPGDVATGGGFMPVLELGYEMSYHASMPYPANYANNPRMNNPTGWTFFSMESGEARVWVVCLDLTPSALATGTVP